MANPSHSADATRPTVASESPMPLSVNKSSGRNMNRQVRLKKVETPVAHKRVRKGQNRYFT